MLKLRKGSRVPFPKKLSEGYECTESGFKANVNEDKIQPILEHFSSIHNEPVFFILELPSNKKDEKEIRPGVVEAIHNDVYYISDCSQEKALNILNMAARIMINDGLCSFGFGCHHSNDEIFVEKYNVVYIFTKNKNAFDGFFEKHQIPLVKKLITAWDTFTRKKPGESLSIDTDGKSIYDIPDMFKDWGMFFVEQRED